MRNQKRMKLLLWSGKILLAGLLSTALAQAQEPAKEVRKNFAANNIAVSELVKRLGVEYPYSFFIADAGAAAVRVSVDAKNATAEQVLTSAFSGKDLTFIKKDRSYTISLKTKQPQQTTKSITGTVFDVEGFPVIGATVVEKTNPNNGTITDVDGKFSITVPQGAVLVFKFIGYATQEIAAKEGAAMQITLSEDIQKLQEVVVVGYGTRQRKSITGAVDQVGSTTFENRPVSNAMQALQGASANLIIQQRNMNPNDNSMSLNIRGVSTMGSNDPLIVIDGLTSGTGTLNNLNPNDIESVSVLKDAGSAAIYGSRSANGVILVTTKKGSLGGKPVVKFNSLIGYQDPDILYQPVKGWQNAMYRDQANVNVGSSPVFTAEQIRDLYDHQDEEYWYLNEIMKSGLQQDYNFSIAGGNTAATYMVSAGYHNQESNFVGNFGLERYNFRSNLTNQFGRLKLTTLLAYNRKMEKTVAGGTGNVIINSSRIPPYYYYQFQKDGKWLINDVIGDDNTMAKLKDGGNEHKDEDNFIGSMNLDLKLFEGLTAKGLIGIDLTQHHRFRRDLKVPLYAEADLETPVLYMGSNTYVEDYNQKAYTLSTQFLLDYARTFNNVHNVSGLLGASNESYTFQASQVAWQYTDVDLGLPTTDESVQIAGNNFNSNASTDETSITSIFGRLGYNYADKYYADFSFRRDGSSKFAKDQRWGFFPSFSAAWRVSEENFMNAYREKYGDLKLRASYGVLGNQNVSNYSYQTVYQMYNNIYAFNNETVPGTGYTYGNPYLTWEKSANLNFGIDATFLDNNLFVSLDYFDKKTWDILLTPVVSSVFGSTAPNENAGEMHNKGWEVTVNYRLKTGDFRHNFNLNVADSKNKVTDFGGNERIDQNDQLYKLIREGEALGSYYGYKTDGLFQSYEEIAASALPVGASVHPGDVKYVDTDKNGVIDEKDRVVLGNAFPRYTYGFTYSVAYKDFDLSILLQGVGKRDQYVRGELIEPFHSNYSYCIYQHQLDFWTPTNPDARWPRLVAPGSPSSTNNWSKAGTDIYMLNGAYLRVKDIKLGYTLPVSLSSKVGIQKLHVSLNAQNPLTLTYNSFIDPESSEFGNNMGGISGIGANSARNYPTLVYYGFGLDIEF